MLWGGGLLYHQIVLVQTMQIIVAFYLFHDKILKHHMLQKTVCWIQKLNNPEVQKLPSMCDSKMVQSAVSPFLTSMIGNPFAPKGYFIFKCNQE